MGTIERSIESSGAATHLNPMELPSRFKKFLERIRPSSAQLNEFRRGHTRLRRLLRSDPGLRRHYITSFLQGSYRRATAIRPMDDQGGSDVDLVLVTALDPKRYSPDRVIGLLSPVLEKHYTKWRPQDRSLRLDLGSVTLDLVLASAPSRVDLLRQEAAAEPLDADLAPTPAELAAWQMEPLLIPDRGARCWRPTHPLAQLAATRGKNAQSGGHYVNVVKAIKWWKLATVGAPEHPKSYPLERVVEVCCPDDIGSVAEGFTRTLEAIAMRYRDGRKPRLAGHRAQDADVLARVPAADFAAFVKCASEAAKVARRAFDSTDEAESAALWRQLLGPLFPATEAECVMLDLPTAAAPTWSLQTVMRTLAERGQMIVSGFDEVAKFKRTLEQAIQQLGVQVVWDPGTPPELKDYLGVVFLDALQWGIAGAAVGVVAGAVLGETKQMIRLGAFAGAALGAFRGHKRVKNGWRLRSGYGEDGEIFVELKMISRT